MAWRNRPGCARIEEQRETNRKLVERNRQLEVEVYELQRGMETIEERAREDLGMVREGETFYQLIEKAPAAAVRGPGDVAEIPAPGAGPAGEPD